MMHNDNEPEQAMHGAEAVAHFLDRKHVTYELIEHHATHAARQEASAAGSPAPRMAKTVVLHDTDGYRIAIIPASERVDLDKARKVFGASADMRLATEREIAQDFPAFDPGALPPFRGLLGATDSLAQRTLPRSASKHLTVASGARARTTSPPSWNATSRRLVAGETARLSPQRQSRPDCPFSRGAVAPPTWPL